MVRNKSQSSFICFIMNSLTFLRRYDWFTVHHKFTRYSYLSKGGWQLPSIPSKHVPVGQQGKGQGASEVSAQLCAMRSGQKPPNMTPEVTTSTGTYPQHIWPWLSIGSQVRWAGQRVPFSPVCLSFINLAPTLLRPPHQICDWQL